MTASEVWKQRLIRRWNYGKRWLHLRAKDLAWLRARRVFKEQVSQALSKHQWIFVVGCNNSGTTLIHDVLAATGKFSFMPHEGQRYTNVLRRAEKRGYERVWSEYLPELRMTEIHSTRPAPRLLFDWLHEIEKPAQARILEKTTANAVRMRWLQRAFPRAAFIGVVRSCYAVAEGIKRKGNKSVDRGARHWKRVNEIMLEDAKSVSRFLLVRYEDFVSSPQQTLPRIASFLDLRSEELMEAFARIDRNPTASSRSSIRDMNAASLQRLSRKELQSITREAGELLTKLGYTAEREVA